MVIKMIKFVNDQEIKEIIANNQKPILVFGKGSNCGVCDAAEFRINNILSKKFPDLDIYYVDLDKNPLFRGQYLIFSVPTILVFENDKEFHRESRIVDFYRLEMAINAISE